MDLYKNHIIVGQNLLPDAGFVEIGLEAGTETLNTCIESDTKLLDKTFISAFELEDGCRIIYNYIYGSVMEFICDYSESTMKRHVDELLFASAASIKANVSIKKFETFH